MSENSKGDHARQQSGEDQRMRESTMSPEVAVVDAKAKPNNVDVGDD